MKILHVLPSLHMGGAEKLIVDSIPLYNKEIESVDVLLLNGKPTALKMQLESIGCKIFILGKNPYNPLIILKIIPYLRKYDLVHVHLFPCLYFVALAHILINSRIPLVYTEHNTHNKRRTRPYLKLFEKFIYNQYKKIIAISNQTKVNLLQWIGNANKEKVQIIENGINISLYSQAIPYNRELLSIPLNAKIILMTARFTINKDHNTLIKALSKIAEKNTYLVFIGDGPLKEDSEELVKQLNLENRVLFLGIRLDVPQLIKMADVCVLSSNWEGFGLVAVEYMAASRPTIVSDVEGLRDIVNNAGILFEKGNDDDLKNKIESIFSDNSYYKDISEKCYNRSLEFGLNKMVNSYINIYKEVLN